MLTAETLSGAEPGGPPGPRQSAEKPTLAAVLGEAHQAHSRIQLEPGPWCDLVDQACGQWLGGLLLEGIDRHHWPIPPSHLPPLYRQALRIQFRNRKLMRTLSNVVALLAREGIPVMVLKGAGLLLIDYDRFDARSMSDLDLLIHPRDVHQTMRVLTAHGCKTGAPLVRKDFFPKYYYETELTTDEPNPVRLDLHARPFRPMRLAQTISDGDIWADAKAIRLSGSESAACANPDDAPVVYVPRDEWMLIQLCAHAAFHGCSRLQWLYDIKRFADARPESLNWELFAERTGYWHLSAAVTAAFDATEKAFGPAVPEIVRKTVAAQQSSWQDRLVLRQAPRDVERPLRHVAVNLLCTPGIRFRLGYLLAQLLPDPAHMAGVYGPRHPGWLLAAHVWRIMRIPMRLVAKFRSRPCKRGAFAPQPTAVPA